jgi:hypothetical protein
MFDAKASQRIGEVYDDLLSSSAARQIPNRPYAERVLWYVVLARCEADINGFASVYQQAFEPLEMENLIDGLRTLEENELADEFARGYELLKLEGYYDHRIWSRISPSADKLIDEIGEKIGDRLWDLDVKMVELLNAEQAAADPERKP